MSRGARVSIPLAVRLWRKVEKTEGCWLWTGSKHRGYGAIFRGEGSREIIPAHRASWELAFGPIPDGLHVLHSCDTAACVRPDHLHLGDHPENMREMAERGRAVSGERHHKTKLGALARNHIIEALESGERKASLARKFGVSWTAIDKVEKTSRRDV